MLLGSLSMALAQVPSQGAEKAPVNSQKVFFEKAGLPGAGNQRTPSNRGNVNTSAFVQLGTTWYDLQTNYAMPHRLILSNNTVLAAWTTSPDAGTNYPNRGTGYNFRNSANTWLDQSSNRVESYRTGWPSIGILSNGKAFAIGHEANNGGFYLSKFASNNLRSVSSSLVLTELPYKPIWARAGNNGDTIHLIYSYTDSAAAGEKRAPTRKGVFAPMVYSRSTDGGSTWGIKALMLPGFDSTLTNNGGADQYAIDVRGNTVAIVNGDLLQGAILWVSHDGGNTFTMEKPMPYAYAPYDDKKLTEYPVTIDFEDIEIIDVLKGNNTSTRFSSGKELKGRFYMNWDGTGTTWNNGWAGSSLDASTAAGQLAQNQKFVAAPGKGYMNSAQYAVGKTKAGIGITTASAKIASMAITLSKETVDFITNGNGGIKKFGGPTGDDKDYLKVTVSGYNQGVKMASQDIYLADYRDNNNSKDYIVSSWQQVKISSLTGPTPETVIDSIGFVVSSSDATAGGLNDLATFAIDNLSYNQPDTTPSCDGTVDVIIDKNDKVHVFWGATFILNNDSTDKQYNFYPTTQSIGYWNEYTKTAKYIASGNAFDTDGDGLNTLKQATYAALGTNSTLPQGLSTTARLGNTSAMRQPNASIDQNGNIYCIFSVPIDTDLSFDNANFRDIGVVFSKDSGKTWSPEQNLTQQKQLEDDFACVARQSDGFLHMMWQQDETPGTNLQNNSSSNNHVAVENKIMYQAVPVSEILNNNIGMYWGLNNRQPKTAGEVMIVNQNFPNPFNGKSNLLIYLTQPGNMTLSIHNALGQEVKTRVYNNLNRGNHLLEINSDGLKAGLYTYSITSGANTITKTMIVQ